LYIYKNNSEDQADFSQIKYCTKANVPFLAHSGGVGWAKIFDLGSTGVLINLAGLNAVTIATNKKTATIGGGASIGDTIAAADAAGALVLTGNCNCVGSLSASLGGGHGTSIPFPLGLSTWT
jgi:FAD/FMN-containing dehydrogenase